MARNGKFHYFAIGKDDNATLSATHMEGRKISLSTFDMSRDCFQILDGVDQLGLLLIARAYNEANGTKPSVYPLYSVGAGASTLPQYSDARLQDSVPQQIIAAGAVQAQSADTADLILALNTPQDGIVKDSTADDNQPSHLPATKILSVSWGSFSVLDATFPWPISAIPTVRTTAYEPAGQQASTCSR